MVALVRQVVDLGVAVVTRRDTVTCLRGQNLVGFALAVSATLFRITGLEKTATAAATVIVRAVGIHFDEIFFTHHGFDNVAQILCHRVPEGFPNELARILYRKLDLTFAVPLGADLEFPLSNPLGVVLNDALDFKIEVDLEFFQSGPDCK